MKTSAYVAVAAVAAAARVPHLPLRRRAARATADGSRAVQPAAVAAAAAPRRKPARCRPRFPTSRSAISTGTPRSIRSWPGKSMIVNFWATWCAPCRREIPLLRELQKQHGAEGFQIVGVAVDVREDVVKYAQEIGIDYPVLIGEQDGLDAVQQVRPGIDRLSVHGVHRQPAPDRAVPPRRDPQGAGRRAARARSAQVNSGKLTPEAARVVAAKQLAAKAPEPAAG